MANTSQPQNDSAPSTVFRQWASAARSTAARCAAQRDSYGVELATSRAAVYDQAAKLVVQLGVTPAAAARLLDNASRLVVLSPPLMNFDAAGISYCTARAWQRCAQELDPTLPEVQPPW